MKKLLCLVLILPTVLFAQETKERTWAIKLNIPQLLDLASFPTVALGAEKKINRYLSVNSELGYQFYNHPDTSVDSTIFYQRGCKANIELRSYIVNSTRNGKFKALFVGIQGFYRWNQYEASISYHTKEEDNAQSKYQNYKDHFGVRKNCVGANVIVGFQYVRYNFLIEPFIGIGYMDRTIRNYDRQFDSEKYEERTGNHDFFSTDLAEDSGAVGNFTVGFRFGYKL